MFEQNGELVAAKMHDISTLGRAAPTIERDWTDGASTGGSEQSDGKKFNCLAKVAKRRLWGMQLRVTMVEMQQSE